MAYNLKAGLMATTTMVGSAVAFTKTQTGLGDRRGSVSKNMDSGQAKTEAYTEKSGKSQKHRNGSNYKDTFEQMMMWK